MTELASNKTDTIKGEDWAGEMGAKWLASLDRFEGMIAPIGDALLLRANYQPGERVLDIGSGGGATTMAIARSVAPGGEVLGIDISPDLVGAAGERAKQVGLDNARFFCADAGAVHLEDEPFDRLFSRFGSMFFEQPILAFANLHRLLKPGARIDLAVWGPPRENLWMMEMMGVVRNHVEIPPAVPRAPGPFAFEDLDYLDEVLSGGGFSDVDVAAYDGLQPVGGSGATPKEAVDFILSSMAVGRALDDQGEDVRARATEELIALFARHHVAGQGVMMGCKAWLVRANA
jgi:ubiquinone/menaquinone biosynthesis C-methylase UbiE